MIALHERRTDCAMEETRRAYDAALKVCKSLFRLKLQDYGSNWRILRPESLTDQLLIKARRIRTLETTGARQVDEGIEPEFIGLVNYAIMSIIQLEKGWLDAPAAEPEPIEAWYDQVAETARLLMIAKNTDYGEAWRDMRISSLTDMVLNRIYRIKQMEDNQGKTKVSEGLDANYLDLINYALFALIRLEVA